MLEPKVICCKSTPNDLSAKGNEYDVRGFVHRLMLLHRDRDPAACQEMMASWGSRVYETEGAWIHYLRTGGNGPPLVLPHGLMGSSACWSPLARALQSEQARPARRLRGGIIEYEVVLSNRRSHTVAFAVALSFLAVAGGAEGIGAIASSVTVLGAAEAERCQGADVDIELCIVPGLRNGTFLLRQSKDGTVVASIPTDPSSCPDQTFDVTLQYPATKPNGSVPPAQRVAPMLTIEASPSNCASAATSRVLRLERSEVNYGLSMQDVKEGTFAPSPASVDAIRQHDANVLDSALASIRPTVAVDSLTAVSGPSRTVAGEPCKKAKRRATCLATYRRELTHPAPYGTARCGRCTVGPQPLALIITQRNVVRSITDLQAFLGPIDTAADAVLLRNATDASKLPGGAWLVRRSEMDGTCNPFERTDVYERVTRDGSVEPVTRLLTSRLFGVCA